MLPSVKRKFRRGLRCQATWKQWQESRFIKDKEWARIIYFSGDNDDLCCHDDDDLCYHCVGSDHAANYDGENAIDYGFDSQKCLEIGDVDVCGI